LQDGKVLGIHFMTMWTYLTVAGRMSDQQEQDSNPGGWRKGRFIMDLSKNGTCPIAQGCGVFMPQNVEASEREGQKQT
jgi:hypothetical protein